MRLHIAAPNMKRHPQLGSRFLDQPFVRIAALPTKLMIEMCHDQLPSHRLRQQSQNMKQHHRIQPAGHSHENFLATPKQFSLADGKFNTFQQIHHTMMLTLRRKPEQGDSGLRNSVKKPPTSKTGRGHTRYQTGYQTKIRRVLRVAPRQWRIESTRRRP